mgnify:FL=1
MIEEDSQYIEYGCREFDNDILGCALYKITSIR